MPRALSPEPRAEGLLMELVVNGERRELPDRITVSQLLETLNIAPERVVVEVNLAILKRAEHQNAILKEGDQIEIVQFVGGGALEMKPETQDLQSLG